MKISTLLILISTLNVAYLAPISPNFDFKISSIHKLLTDQSNTCTEIIEFFINRCKKFNPLIKALNTLNENALKEAQELDNYNKNHQKFKGPLHCIPVLIKDNIDVSGLPTTGGINALRNSFPQTDAPLVKSLKNAGAIILAKANMAELAMGTRYESEIGGACQNPYDFLLTCGASSSGSAAGVSAALAPISIGSDTDASIMNPASFCGVFGLRPPINDLNTNGVIPLFTKQDTVGPIAKHLDDLVLTYSVLKGDDGIFTRYLNTENSKKYRILNLINFFDPFNLTLSAFDATFYYYFDDAVNKSMKIAFENIKKLSNNFELVDGRLNQSFFNDFSDKAAQILQSQFVSCAPCFFTIELNEFFKKSGPNVAFHSIGEFLASKDLSEFWKQFFEKSGDFDLNGNCSKECEVYDKAIGEFKRDFVSKWFDNFVVDVILLPTMTNLPGKINEIDETRADAMFISSYSGFAALNLPVGFSEVTKNAPDGLPVGLTLLATPGKIEDAFKVAKIYSGQFIKVKLVPKNIESGSQRNSFNFILIPFYLMFSIFFSYFEYD